MSLRSSSQVADCINRGSRAPHQGTEEMHEETYLLIHELTTGGASSEVRPDQGGHLVLIRRGASSEVAGRIDVSTLLHVNM